MARFGPKPDGVTMAQRGALQKLHLNLSHPSVQAMKRRLKSHGVPVVVLEAVDREDTVVDESVDEELQMEIAIERSLKSHEAK